MDNLFSPDFFSRNRVELTQLFKGKAPIVISAHGLMQRGGESTYPFHQDASFWYLTGIDDPDCILVLDKSKEYLILPQRSAVQQVFDGELKVETIRKLSGIDTVVGYKEGWKLLGARLKKAKHVATLPLPPLYSSTFGFYFNPSRQVLLSRIKELNPDISVIDLRQALSRLRSVKQPEELAAIQKAIDITISSLNSVSRPSKFSKYTNESEIEADLTRTYKLGGAEEHGFTPIIAGGSRACVVHNMNNDQPLRAGELVLIDTGAQFNHYSADITRTYCYKKPPSSRQQAIYDAVLEVQNYGLSLLSPGTIIKDYEKSIEQFMGEKLRELGLIKIISTEAVRQFYPHAASHFLGLEVHDIGDYSAALEPNMVVTVEPGIYLPAEKIGVRIEDDVVITEDGNKVLSARLSRLLA
jgi:Xaa-Pro aminopeptidase